MERESSKECAQLSFCGEREAFHQEIVLRGIQPCFLHGVSVSVIFLVSTFESFLGIREFFPRLSAIFLSGRGNLKENFVTLFTKFDWSVISSSRSKYGTFENK